MVWTLATRPEEEPAWRWTSRSLARRGGSVAAIVMRCCCAAFGIPVGGLESCPLELEFRNPRDPQDIGIVDLDV